VSLGRVSVLSLSISLCIVLLAALIPARSAKQRIRQRAKAARETTDQVTQRHGVKARYRYDSAVTGFSARMTPAEAAQIASDPSVANVRVARHFKIAAQTVPPGIQRVMALAGGAGLDVEAHVAVVDTGIGPAAADGTMG